MKAVIQAGGKGTRLRPYTFIMPKPMMPVGDQPVIEVLLKWMRRWGIKDAYITTGYLGHLIKAHCNDGCQFDMSIKYSEESEPMGTIGALRLLDEWLDDTFFTLNGDLITNINLRDFYNYHKSHDGSITVGVTEKIVKVDLGVLDCKEQFMTGFREKPELNYNVSMGIYCMEPEVLKLIPRGVPFGFDDLMHEMLANNLPVHVFQHKGLWLDIGREEDFRYAQNGFMAEYKEIMLGC
jgi:mannose-1-phosphate guanylyltransferase